MKEILSLRNMTLSELVDEIDSKRQKRNPSSAIRLFVNNFKSCAHESLCLDQDLTVGQRMLDAAL